MLSFPVGQLFFKFPVQDIKIRKQAVAVRIVYSINSSHFLVKNFSIFNYL